MIPLSISCPICGTDISHDAEHHKVSGIYSQITSTDTYGIKSQRQNQLSRYLAPPPDVYLSGCLGFSFSPRTFVLSIILSLVFALFKTDIVVMLILSTPLFFLLVREVGKEKARNKKDNTNLQKAKALWANSFYCSRHDWVFDPTGEINASSIDLQSRINELINK